MGAALAATRLSLAEGFDQGRHREQARSHIFRSRRERRLWEQPSLPTEPEPRASHCPPPLSGSEDPSHRPPPGLRLPRACPQGGNPVGAALAATRPLLTAGFDQGRHREQARSHSLRSRRERRLWEQPSLPAGREPGAARCPPPLSGSEDPSHSPPGLRLPLGRAPKEETLWERPWPRRGCRWPQALIKVAIASKHAPTVFSPQA